MSFGSGAAAWPSIRIPDNRKITDLNPSLQNPLEGKIGNMSIFLNQLEIVKVEFEL
jgi:hypothetical protein